MAACTATAAALMLLAGCGTEVAAAGRGAGVPDSAATVKSSGSDSDSAGAPGAAGSGGAAEAAGGAGAVASSSDDAATVTSSAGAGTGFPARTADSPITSGGGSASGAPGENATNVVITTPAQVAAELAKDPEDYLCTPKLPPGTGGQLVLLLQYLKPGAFPGALRVLDVQTVCGPDIPGGQKEVLTSPAHELQLSPKATFDLDGSQPGVMVWATLPQFIQLALERQGYGPFGWDGPYFVVQFDANGDVIGVTATTLP